MTADVFASQDEIVALLKSGQWELGYSSGARGDGRYWMQKNGLMRGGDTRRVRAGTAQALKRKGLIRSEPKRPNDPFWLRRYGLAQMVEGYSERVGR